VTPLAPIFNLSLVLHSTPRPTHSRAPPPQLHRPAPNVASPPSTRCYDPTLASVAPCLPPATQFPMLLAHTRRYLHAQRPLLPPCRHPPTRAIDVQTDRSTRLSPSPLRPSMILGKPDPTQFGLRAMPCQPVWPQKRPWHDPLDFLSCRAGPWARTSPSRLNIKKAKNVQKWGFEL
jgi:hypothetical protein